MRTGFLIASVMTPSVLAHAHLKQQIPAADSVVNAPQALR
jgi:methionine-rich copper-binding protein CopC